MKIKNLGNNKTEVYTKNGVIFFSYATPVCANIDGAFYRTDKYYSVTTSKHINNWLDGRQAEKKSPEFFESLLD